MKKQGQEVPFPGVDNTQGRGAVKIKHTKYYQWVAFTLFFQVSLKCLKWGNYFKIGKLIHAIILNKSKIHIKSLEKSKLFLLCHA